METDLAEALQFTADQATKAAGASNKVAVLKLPDEPEGVYGLVGSDGRFERIVGAAKPRSHALHRVDQVVDFVLDAETRLNASPTVWYSRKGVQILLVDDSLAARLESRANITFAFTPQFHLLANCAEGSQWFDPKQLCLWVRTKLLDCLPTSREFLATIRDLRFSVQTGGKSHIGQGRESLGREVDAEVVSEFGDLPEELLFQVRVMDDPSLLRRQPIRCALEIDPQKCLLRIVPLAGEVQNALDAELESIGEMLKSTLKCPVYHGVP